MTVPPPVPPTTEATVPAQQEVAPDDGGLSRRVEEWSDEVHRHLERLARP